jgi:hypothetical protein
VRVLDTFLVVVFVNAFGGEVNSWLFARGSVSFSSDVQILAEVSMVIVFDNVSQRLNRQVRMDAI